MKALETNIHNPPFIHEYTLSPPLRATITGLQNFRCLALKYLWRCTHSRTLSRTSRSSVPLVFVLHILLLLVLALFSALYFAYIVDLITFAKKPRELIWSLLYARREVQKMGEVPPFASCTFFHDLFPLRLPVLALASNLYPISRFAAVGRLSAQRRCSVCGCTKVERMVVPNDRVRGDGGEAGEKVRR